MTTLSIDFETRATVDLRKTGVYPYAQHPDTDIWCMAWAFGDDEPEVWVPWHGSLPPRIADHIRGGGEIRAWNAQFERVIWTSLMVKRYGAPNVALEQWVCTAAEAAAMALPRSLDACARVVKVDAQKDGDGYNLMMRMTRPRELRQEDGSPIWWDEAGSRELARRKAWRPKQLADDLADVQEKHRRLHAYCQQDIRTERSTAKVLRRLVPRERELYLLDQKINDRGIFLDQPLVDAAARLVVHGTARADEEMDKLTSGYVPKVSNRNLLCDWVNEQGVATESLKKAQVAELLGGDLTDPVRQALELRAEAGRASVAKLQSMRAVACDDSRLRGLALFHGASTGRWTGRLVQPHNFPRGEVPDVEDFIPDVLADKYDLIDLFASPIVVVSSMLRAMLCAGPGHELTAADFSAIECRVLNWLAGQDDVCESFRLYDGGDKSRDPYKVMSVKMGLAPNVDAVTKQQRNGGKAAELGCGFGMGWRKFVDAAWAVYQFRVTEQEAKAAVSIYRSTHPFVVKLWDDANNAALRAVEEPGTVHVFGGRQNLKLTQQGAYLYLVLPSRRPLVYAAPRIVDRETPWGELRPAVEVSVVDDRIHQWGRLGLYGGLITENIVQAVARDLLAEALFRLEAAGYPVVMHVHDEVVTETPLGFGSVAELELIMETTPHWADGCPVKAEGWRGARYRK